MIRFACVSEVILAVMAILIIKLLRVNCHDGPNHERHHVTNDLPADS